jgi:hypothetical protein
MVAFVARDITERGSEETLTYFGDGGFLPLFEYCDAPDDYHTREAMIPMRYRLEIKQSCRGSTDKALSKAKPVESRGSWGLWQAGG